MQNSIERDVEHLRKALHRGPVTHSQAAQKVHGTSWFGRFNTKVAVVVTEGVGTMTCAYLFTILSLISLPSVIQGVTKTGDVQTLISWIAQTFLQLVLLSVIMVGQRVQQTASDGRAEQDHEILSALHTINNTQLVILQRLDAQGPAKGSAPNANA
ncbi:MAG: hypothetical protein WAM30_04105 [Candidatus Dormiibacterota bacterium]